MSPWVQVGRAHPEVAQLADRHYTRRPSSRGNAQFAPPGRVVILLARSLFGSAAWVSRASRHDKHAWPGAWTCTLFRNESRCWLSSDLVRAAVAATEARWGRPPVGWLTFVQPQRVQSRNPGFCFLKAGWRRLGMTAGGHGRPRLLVLGLGDQLREVSHAG